MTSLTAIFGNSDEKPSEEESDKLLKLYWNRAELKKEFAGLRDEQFRLQDRIKEEEGAAARVQQKLDHLERLLLDPEWVYNVIIYYQLRRLNLRCQGKIEAFAEQLKQQREQRQHEQRLVDWNESRRQEAASIEDKIGEHRLQVQMLEDQLQHERHRQMSMSGFLKIFRGRAINGTLDGLAESIAAAQQDEEQLLLQYDEIQNRVPPDTEGLDTSTKRRINFMVLAFVQHVYLHFYDDELASMAKEAGEKSVGAINYGTKQECDVIVALVLKRIESFDKVTDFADVLQQRAKLIEKNAVFLSDDDAVPVSSTVATLFEISKKGVIKKRDANLLEENYWNVSEILSR
ncbi:MAG: gp58-like family protein [Gammaproteobacteria bacterium]|nr:gp58-like family protein [Gammaproteobacteria bacterium]MDH3749662.1 gp58-like family protein [Gammaproteobacteria bacterium]MDH3804214.1 gp58-like family protein [Gammaproteobacteria bacterium]